MAPNNLSYPEIFPKECLYNTEKQLSKMLRTLVKSGSSRIKEKIKSHIIEEKFNSQIIAKHIISLIV